MARMFCGRRRVSVAGLLTVAAGVAVAGCGESFTASEGAGGTTTTDTSTGGAGAAAGSGGTTSTAHCQDGETQECYDGPIETTRIGECKSGTQTCSGGAWGQCEGQVLPAAKELCDGVKDENCDGNSEEGCSCTAGASEACYGGAPGTEGNPPCHGGMKQCVEGLWSECAGQTLPMVESCDEVDNDCNGVADDVVGVGTECNTGLSGICEQGSLQCPGDSLVPVCVPNQEPATEVCDALDNNCDGETDESFPEQGLACNIVGGTCQGTYACSGGTKKCVSMPNDLPELCGDGVDNDCDGAKDPAPAQYFGDDFGNALNQGWTLGTEWAIGPAVGSVSPSMGFFGDPAVDHSSLSVDNRLAGVVIGGNTTTNLHAPYYLTSKAVDLTAAPGSVVLSFYRFLNSDYPPYMTSTVEVYDGAAWVVVWQNSDNGGAFSVADDEWTPQVFNVTPYKNNAFRVRFGVAVAMGGAFSVSSWNVDDVRLSSCYAP